MEVIGTLITCLDIRLACMRGVMWRGNTRVRRRIITLKFHQHFYNVFTSFQYSLLYAERGNSSCFSYCSYRLTSSCSFILLYRLSCLLPITKISSIYFQRKEYSARFEAFGYTDVSHNCTRRRGCISYKRKTFNSLQPQCI